MLSRIIVTGLTAGFKAVEATDRAFSLLPPYRLGRDLLLDTVLGPAEDFEYVSRTTPTVTPQTIS